MRGSNRNSGGSSKYNNHVAAMGRERWKRSRSNRSEFADRLHKATLEAVAKKSTGLIEGAIVTPFGRRAKAVQRIEAANSTTEKPENRPRPNAARRIDPSEFDAAAARAKRGTKS